MANISVPSPKFLHARSAFNRYTQRSRKGLGIGALAALLTGLTLGCAEEKPAPPGVACAAHPTCGLDGPACDSGQECIAIPGCPSAICIAFEQACLETCGAPSCLLLESFPAQIACEEGKPVPGNSGSSCAELEQRRDAELAQIQACSSAAECGQVLEGTSCGCTRNLVAQSDADIARFQEIQAAMNAAECGGFVSTCDCPPADGFACEQGRCTWNYVDADSPAL